MSNTSDRFNKKDKNQHRQRHQSQRNTTYHRRSLFNGLPYDKLNPRIDDQAHIRWTSSNFLHSGTWETHRDNLLFNDIDTSLIFYNFPFNNRFFSA
ncbi:hypothetical protein RhiirA4_484943 [Rhizophagus irregularis]|uniref:Uncharacterized protein n=1 Tax=Rhizophagus irregularis TaxID=588596 RepID=A0A2I1HPI6_9GLOM|nr:hypothetical protein RhiirA4_484943 [Rhizophagus irregularis]